MSQWGTLEAQFVPGPSMLTAETLRREIAERGPFVPTGSEDGPSVYEHDGKVTVEGRLRDVSDDEDSPIVLAWFVHHARWCEEADLLWDLDSGPRYRYEWRKGTLTRLKGALDQ